MIPCFLRMVGSVVMLCTGLLFAQSPASSLSESMHEFMTTLEELSNSTVLRSDDTYFVNDLFLSISRQNPTIISVTRMTPEGIVTNRVTARGIGAARKNVSGERWFGVVCASMQPYANLLTESSGRISLLCAWPLVDDSAQPPLLAGIFSVKINVRELLASLLKYESGAVSALHGTTTLFSRGWREGKSYREEVLWLTKTNRITVRYQEKAFTSDRGETGLTDTASVPVPGGHGKQARTAGMSASIPPVSVKGKSLFEHELDSPIAMVPVVHPTAFTDSFLLASDLPAGASGKMIVIASLAVLTLIAILFALVAAIRLMPKRNEAHAISRILSPGPIDAIVIPGDSAMVIDSRAEISSAERETKQLPAIRELIAESSRKLKFMDGGIDPALRAHLLKGIHENLSLWVSAEISHLSGHLAALSESIRACEAMNGNAPELQVLRYEIERIIEELQCVDRKIPSGFFS
ncbi:MAG: hypothetical protein JXA71_12095 [Chitinispirillaceae bacterium]|nr:hypothetical protein [Chitinispirillaceae bacterium]